MQTASVAGIPILWEQPAHAQDKRLVIWLPGFADGKESVGGSLRDLAAAGYIALSFDPVDHGERGHRSAREIADPTGGRFRNVTDGRIYRHFWSILAETAEEVPVIIDWAIHTLDVSPSVGIGGKSMGGDIAVTAAGLEPRISVVAACIATADWLKPGSIYQLNAPNPVIQAQYERYNPLTNLERYRRCPAITFQCSAADPIVPADGALRFARALEGAYATCPEKLEVVIEDGVEHQLTETMWRNALRWFAKYLKIAPR